MNPAGGGRPGIEVAPLEPGDRRWAEALLREAWFGDAVVVGGEVIALGGLAGLVARVDGRLAGLATYRVRGGACELVTLNAAVEGRGVGIALVEGVRAVAGEAGCRTVRVVTTNDNRRALDLYARAGFRVAAVRRGAVNEARARKPTIPTHAPDGTPIEDEIELELDLTPADVP